MAEEREEPEETGQHPALTYKEARSYILTPLPKGFYFHQQRNREEGGKCPCVFQWKGQDPPPLDLPKSRSVVRLTDEEFQELKLLFDNRLVVSPLERTLRSELEVLLENKLKEQADNFSNDLKETENNILNKIKKITQAPKSSEGTEETEKPSISSGSGGEEPAGKEKPDISEFTSWREIAFSGVKRTMPVNPLMAMYYGLAVTGGLGEGFRKDPRKYSIEQFITDIVIDFFNAHGVTFGPEFRGR